MLPICKYFGHKYETISQWGISPTHGRDALLYFFQVCQRCGEIKVTNAMQLRGDRLTQECA